MPGNATATIRRLVAGAAEGEVIVQQPTRAFDTMPLAGATPRVATLREVNTSGFHSMRSSSPRSTVGAVSSLPSQRPDDHFRHRLAEITRRHRRLKITPPSGEATTQPTMDAGGVSRPSSLRGSSEKSHGRPKSAPLGTDHGSSPRPRTPDRILTPRCSAGDMQGLARRVLGIVTPELALETTSIRPRRSLERLPNLSHPDLGVRSRHGPQHPNEKLIQDSERTEM